VNLCRTKVEPTIVVAHSPMDPLILTWSAKLDINLQAAICKMQLFQKQVHCVCMICVRLIVQLIALQDCHVSGEVNTEE